MIRWLLIVVTGLALLFSACGKMGSGEKIAVVNWDKALENHPQYASLQRLKDEYNLLLDKRREQEIIGKTQISGLAKLHQLKRSSKQNFLSADFMTRMAEKQAVEQKKLKQLSGQLADEVDKELAEEEKKLESHYQLRLFNLRLKLDTVRMMPEARKQLEAELKEVQAARDRDRMILMQHKIGLVNQRMDAYAKQLQMQMMESMRQSAEKDTSALQKAPTALKDLLGTVDQELDQRQQEIETLETSLKKDMESIVAKLAKQRGYTVIFHKYRTNVSADDITGDVIAGVKSLAVRKKAAEALSKKVPAETRPEQENKK